LGGQYCEDIGALGELAAGAGIALSKRRVFQKHNYRAFHVLGVNIDAAFTPPGDHPLREMLSREFCDGRDVVIRRCVVLGVRLRRSVVSSSMATMVDRMAASFQSGRGALATTDEDFEHVRAIMARWGLSTPTRQDRSLVRAWWNAGRSPDTPYMVEPERLHILRSAEAARKAHDLYEAGVPLERWPTIPGHSVLTFASVTEFEVPDVDVLDPRASWLTPLINAGAVCVSVNGLLEPGYMTAREIERNKNRYESDIRDGGRYGKDATPEQVDKLRALTRVREVYAGGSTAPPSIIDASVVVAFEGDGKDLARTQFPGVQVAVLGNRQVGAMAETWLAPTSRSNPMLHDMPIDLLAYSGLCSLSVVGDRPAGSALVGYTEMDRQPVWANVAAASSQADLPPLYGVFGESGSGKSLLMLWLCLQHAALGHRTVYIDPKEGSDFSRVVERYGGQTVCLSDVIGSRGILDPLNLTDTPDDGLALAIAMLAYIAPWGSRTRDMELDLTVALRDDFGSAGVVMALSVLAAFVSQMLRRGGRDGLVEDLSSTVAGNLVVVCGTGWCALEPGMAAPAVIVPCALALFVGAVLTTLRVRAPVLELLTVVVPALVAGAAGGSLAAVGFFGPAHVGIRAALQSAAACLAVGFVAGILMATANRVLWTHRWVPGGRAAVASAIVPVLAVGGPVYAIARLLGGFIAG